MKGKMKATIKRVSYTEFFDLSNRLIKHMCYYLVHYSTGAKKEYHCTDFAELPATVRCYIQESKIIGTTKGFYCESAYTTTITYKRSDVQ